MFAKLKVWNQKRHAAKLAAALAEQERLSSAQRDIAIQFMNAIHNLLSDHSTQWVCTAMEMVVLAAKTSEHKNARLYVALRACLQHDIKTMLGPHTTLEDYLIETSRGVSANFLTLNIYRYALRRYWIEKTIARIKDKGEIAMAPIPTLEEFEAYLGISLR